MYEVSSSPENGNEFYSFASDFNPLSFVRSFAPALSLPLLSSFSESGFEFEWPVSERFEENIFVEVPIQMNCPRCGKEMWTKVKTQPLETGDKGCWSRFFCWVSNIFFGSKS